MLEPKEINHPPTWKQPINQPKSRKLPLANVFFPPQTTLHRNVPEGNANTESSTTTLNPQNIIVYEDLQDFDGANLSGNMYCWRDAVKTWARLLRHQASQCLRAAQRNSRVYDHDAVGRRDRHHLTIKCVQRSGD